MSRMEEAMMQMTSREAARETEPEGPVAMGWPVMQPPPVDHLLRVVELLDLTVRVARLIALLLVAWVVFDVGVRVVGLLGGAADK